ncbi:7-cyano-7-deazaguanine synthase [Sulfuracidifex metallicus]|uniref:7-cyano-7-deazaguanine synthase n=1 Tax=Sulfuracidifex metallicus DSM 6482 = JCM 9184 TaxID=523847 RepID=A0A6A9QMQ0_SULME|nr:7-cyano-7-deazaguanine synthase [Sulfuracidifex metallicus]MUN28471.1 7-cyano-7-deazaguanine synthase [Sulfuracidifex metallicus DSM 6482 = JCM 9184]WOE51012.1 7-cyano-7-deazaguanine synthase [Sulfuracidifex metallicus DSM 6482 = JCM 9184]
MVEEAIIQLTGGIDSTVLAYYLEDKYVLHGTFIHYGYPPQIRELELVKELSKKLDIPLHIIDFSSYIKSFDLPPIDSIQYIIKYQFVIEILASFSAYPNLNTMFVGWLKDEWNNRMSLLKDIESLMGFKVIAPFRTMVKSEVIKLGYELGIDFTKTHSCIVSGKMHCGICMACRSRRRAFEEAKVKDPTIYYYNLHPAEIDKLSRELSLEELVERYFRPFLQYTGEYPKDFVDNLVNILKKYNG